MRIQIITNDNGVGLSHDIAVLKEAFHLIGNGSIEVKYTHWLAPEKVPTDHFDYNFHLELVNPAFFDQGRVNYLVPNPEWFEARWRPHLSRFDAILVKTMHAMTIFRNLTKTPPRFIGWTSTDIYDASVPRKHAMVHVAGKSSAKGTEEVLAAMRMLPNLELTMVSSIPRNNVPPNVKVWKDLPAAELHRIMNECRIHLCPSAMEGFGHYINEARACGALVVTTNAEPMNELVGPAIGIGAGVKSVSNQHATQLRHVDPDSLAACIRVAMGCPDDALGAIGAKARAAYLDGRAFFQASLKATIQ